MKRGRDSISDDRLPKRARQDAQSIANGATNGAGAQAPDAETVYAAGARIYDLVFNAQDKLSLSEVFMTVPPKADYPDYYQIIKHPIALDDIKTFLDRRMFRTIESVKDQFDTMFKNAKKYNVKDSQIWRDAKVLQKMVSNEYKSIMGIEDDAGSDNDAHKSKTNVTRAMKSHLAKLIQKTDPNGRVVAVMFMELPSRQEYDYYYKVIKKPMSFNLIAAKIKKGDYATMDAFNSDVILVFSNAMQFNTEESQIYEDALVLKEYSRQLLAMEAAPSAQDSGTGAAAKIRLKLPTAAPVTSPVKKEEPSLPTPAPVTLKLPVAPMTSSTKPAASAPRQAGLHMNQQAAPTPAIPPRPPSPKLPVAPNTSQTLSAKHRPTIPLPKAKVTVVPKTAGAPRAISAPKLALSPAPAMPTSSHAIPAPMPPPPQLAQTARAPLPYYHPPPLPPSATPKHVPTPPPQPKPAAPQPQTPAVIYKYETPDPLPEIRYPLARVVVQTLPDLTSNAIGRTWKLNYRDGVAVWAVRLGRADKVVRVSDMQLRHPDEVANDDDGEMFLKVNGKQVEVSESAAEASWEHELAAGLNVLELGTRGGQTWKMYMDRP
ncbi:Bromodomain-containing protein [Auriculariales sp. MPI-PUGE-AT-0066]|nr:Bromodomain-containing protein [Auriculariales sp. MPI-PUGE-AT-0066]